MSKSMEFQNYIDRFVSTRWQRKANAVYSLARMQSLPHGLYIFGNIVNDALRPLPDFEPNSLLQ